MVWHYMDDMERIPAPESSRDEDKTNNIRNWYFFTVAMLFLSHAYSTVEKTSHIFSYLTFNVIFFLKIISQIFIHCIFIMLL